jgi:hypothetical protein
VSSVASPCTAGKNLLMNTLVLTVVSTFLAAVGVRHGIKVPGAAGLGIHGCPSTVSGGIAACTNCTFCLLIYTLGDVKGLVIAFAGNSQGPLNDVVSIVFGPIRSGICLLPLLNVYRSHLNIQQYSYSLHVQGVCTSF